MGRMAPEVITAEQQNTSYDHSSDIWSLAITAIEMAECSPPMFDLHPMRVLFMIPKVASPTLKATGNWSDDFRDYLARCLKKDPEARPEAQALLDHPFFKPHPNASDVIIELIERARLVLITYRRFTDCGRCGNSGIWRESSASLQTISNPIWKWRAKWTKRQSHRKIKKITMRRQSWRLRQPPCGHRRPSRRSQNRVKLKVTFRPCKPPTVMATKTAMNKRLAHLFGTTRCDRMWQPAR